MKTKFILFLICSVFFIFQGISQNTLTLQPDAASGNDVVLSSLSPNTNYATHLDFMPVAWTVQGQPVITRSLIGFDLSIIPVGATVLDATLTLYGHTSPANGAHSSLSGSNTSIVQKVTSNWDESTVTWATQPSTTSVDEVILPPSSSANQDYDIDVSAIAQNMVDNPADNYGFMLKLQTESYYRRMIFASSDNSDASLHPKLVITYQLNCDANNHVYWTDWATNNIRRGNHDGTGATTIISSENTPRGIELDLENDKLYFADGQSNVIKRANLDGSGKSVITSASEPVDLALDLENSRLFYADTGDDKIKRVNLDGTNAVDIKTGLVNPQGVAYDENLELLFWSDVDGQVIQSANGDGSNVQTIVTNHTPLRITLDKVNQKIYWVERSPGLIKCANYDGSDATIVTSISTATGIKIDNAYNKVYWNENGSNSIKRMNFDGTNQETVFSGLPGLSGIALDLGCLSLTTEEQIDELEDLIADLENSGSLNQGNANALYNKLTSILQKLENGQIGAACSKLNAFIIQVGNFINNGSLTQAEGQPLLNLAADIMDQIGCNGARFSDSEEPGAVVLHQNYPNPAFNQFETNISFYLPYDTKVRLQVFDIYGRLVSSLVDEHLPEGEHIVPFQTQSMKSGLYLYRLEAKNFQSTKSMVILNE